MRFVEPIIRFDMAFSSRCLSNRFNAPLSVLSRWVSHTGDGPLYLLVALWVYHFEPVVGTLLLKTALIAFAIELPIYWLIKNTTRRRRPFECSQNLTSFIEPADRFSLPSGHMAGAAVMATLIATLFPQLLGVAVLWAVAIGAARVMLGVHFFSDIAVGAGLGFFSAYLAMTMTM